MAANRTNQKLFFAQILMDGEATLTAGDQVIHRKAIEEAIAESVAWQLFCAYRALLYEIVESYQLGLVPEEVETAQALAALCAEKGRIIPEFNRLAQLECDESAWLSSLLALAAQANRISQNENGARKEASVQGNGKLIAMDTNNEDKLAQLRGFHRALTGLVDEIRENIHEW